MSLTVEILGACVVFIICAAAVGGGIGGGALYMPIYVYEFEVKENILPNLNVNT